MKSKEERVLSGKKLKSIKSSASNHSAISSVAGNHLVAVFAKMLPHRKMFGPKRPQTASKDSPAIICSCYLVFVEFTAFCTYPTRLMSTQAAQAPGPNFSSSTTVWPR